MAACWLGICSGTMRQKSCMCSLCTECRKSQIHEAVDEVKTTPPRDLDVVCAQQKKCSNGKKAVRSRTNDQLHGKAFAINKLRIATVMPVAIA